MEEQLGRFKISTKILALLILLSAVTFGIAIMGSRAMNQSNEDYSVLTDHVLPANTKLARVNRLALAMVYAGYRALVYDGNSKEARTAVEEVEKDYTDVKALLTEIETLDPSASDKVREISTEIDAIYASVKQSADGVASDQCFFTCSSRSNFYPQKCSQRGLTTIIFSF